MASINIKQIKVTPAAWKSFHYFYLTIKAIFTTVPIGIAISNKNGIKYCIGFLISLAYGKLQTAR